MTLLRPDYTLGSSLALHWLPPTPVSGLEWPSGSFDDTLCAQCMCAFLRAVLSPVGAPHRHLVVCCFCNHFWHCLWFWFHGGFLCFLFFLFSFFFFLVRKKEGKEHEADTRSLAGAARPAVQVEYRATVVGVACRASGQLPHQRPPLPASQLAVKCARSDVVVPNRTLACGSARLSGGQRRQTRRGIAQGRGGRSPGSSTTGTATPPPGRHGAEVQNRIWPSPLSSLNDVIICDGPCSTRRGPQPSLSSHGFFHEKSMGNFSRKLFVWEFLFQRAVQKANEIFLP